MPPESIREALSSCLGTVAMGRALPTGRQPFPALLWAVGDERRGQEQAGPAVLGPCWDVTAFLPLQKS